MTSTTSDRGPLHGDSGARCQHRLRRADHGDAARRLRRGRPQDRAADRGPGTHPRLSVKGHGLWWKVIARNKDAMTLDVRTPEGREIMLRLVADSDVMTENFRPGVLEGWGLGPDELLAVNPGLVLLRTTGFGQDGPYARRRAFGSLAEAHDRVRAPDRPARRAADAAAVRPRRRRRRHHRGVRGDDGAARARPRRRRRAGPGDRPVAVRAAAGDHGPDAERVRPARRGAAAAGQPLAQQRPPQHLPDPRRAVGGGVVRRDLGRRAGDAAGRAPGPGRAAVVLLRRGAGGARRRARRRGAGMDRRPRPRRRRRRVRGGRVRRCSRCTTSRSCSPTRRCRRATR